MTTAVLGFKKRLFGVLALAAALYLAYLPRFYVGFFNDDARFILAAQSLLQGGYRRLAAPEHPPLNLIFPGYPFLLTLFVKLTEPHKVRLAFDAVGGDLTSRVASSLMKDAQVIVYGALAGENCQMSPLSLIFEEKTLEGFWVSEWIKKIGFIKKIRMAAGAQKLLSTELATHVQARFPLEKVQDAIALYKETRTDGKVLLCPR